MKKEIWVLGSWTIGCLPKTTYHFIAVEYTVSKCSRFTAPEQTTHVACDGFRNTHFPNWKGLVLSLNFAWRNHGGICWPFVQRNLATKKTTWRPMVSLWLFVPTLVLFFQGTNAYVAASVQYTASWSSQATPRENVLKNVHTMANLVEATVKSTNASLIAFPEGLFMELPEGTTRDVLAQYGEELPETLDNACLALDNSTHPQLKILACTARKVQLSSCWCSLISSFASQYSRASLMFNLAPLFLTNPALRTIALFGIPLL